MTARGFADWEESQYKHNFRMGREAFWRLHVLVGNSLTRQDTHMRKSVSSSKRLAITLHWFAHAPSYAQLALLYGVGKTTAVHIVHDTVNVFVTELVPKTIAFPQGPELTRVMADFQDLCGLPYCGGAIDGTFMEIEKPVAHGDVYWCYKKYPAIMILGTVDARGIFINVNCGRPGSVGDAATFAASALRQKIVDKVWLVSDPLPIGGMAIQPYLVADSAFALNTFTMKCFSTPVAPQQQSFNYRLIRTRRVVEQAFGRLKGRFRILVHSSIRNPRFAADVAVVACSLHNLCERWSCPFEQQWTIDPAQYAAHHPGQDEHANAEREAGGDGVRNAIAAYTHANFPLHQV
ncbi:uncharacterized protein LOC135820166 [Sycon ciliatum]|uniref:uncharacterized protein LOC135820166 n=1 Tax=Sycon ciliatum TaxID=27933 RepID=UPI0031F609F5